MPHEFQRHAAGSARLSVTTINKIVELKVTRLARRVDEVAQR